MRRMRLCHIVILAAICCLANSCASQGASGSALKGSSSRRLALFVDHIYRTAEGGLRAGLRITNESQAAIVFKSGREGIAYDAYCDIELLRQNATGPAGDSIGLRPSILTRPLAFQPDVVGRGNTFTLLEGCLSDGHYPPGAMHTFTIDLMGAEEALGLREFLGKDVSSIPMRISVRLTYIVSCHAIRDGDAWGLEDASYEYETLECKLTAPLPRN